MNGNLFDGKEFLVGCNYWASHAGPRMWCEWNPEIVEEDLRRLAARDIRLLRVFPNWRDFQPLEAMAECCNRPAGMRMAQDRVLPDSGPGSAGVDPVMLERFRVFARLAEKHGIRLIVSLLAGWMSGRMFLPPAFERRNLLTDPEVIHWEVRFVRTLVRELRNEVAVVAWEPGNECDCMQQVSLPELWLWFDVICGAIRREDRERPVISGSNSRPEGSRIADRAESADILCAHSYAAFSKHCRVDPVNTMRNAFQAVFMTRCCIDLGGKDAFIEEIGSFGPTQNGEEESAAFLENVLWNAWSHDCRALLWWCAFDQTELDFHPYDECSMERELGLFRADGSAKPALETLARFSRFAAAHSLPPPRREAVVLLTREQDCWSAGFLSFLLAKRAGFDVTFQFADAPLRPAPLYLMPSVTGFRILPRNRYCELLAAVERGASFYVSADDAGIEPFAPFGVPIRTVSGRKSPARLVFADGLELTLDCPHEIRLGGGGAEVLAHDGEGNFAFTCNPFGRGKLFFLNVPLETALAPQPRLFEADSQPYDRIYRILAEKAGLRRLATRDNPAVTLTEHPVSDCCVRVVAVNNSPEPQEVHFKAAPGWCFAGVLPSVLEGNTGTMLEMEKISCLAGVGPQSGPGSGPFGPGEVPRGAQPLGGV